MNRAAELFASLYNPLLEDPLSAVVQFKAKALQAELRNCRSQVCVASVDPLEKGVAAKLVRLAFELQVYDIEIFEQRSQTRNFYLFLFYRKAVPEIEG